VVATRGGRVNGWDPKAAHGTRRFQPGHDLSTRHGAYSLVCITADPRVAELAEQITGSQPVSHPADAGAVQRLAVVYVRIERALAAIGRADEVAASDPAGAYRLKRNQWMDRLRHDLAMWIRVAGSIEAELARTPASRAKLGLHLASAQRQLTVVELHEQAERERAEQADVEAEQAVEDDGGAA
jgi:hypothetical protein